MPRILKSLLKSALSSRIRKNEQTHAQPLSPGAFSRTTDCTSAYSNEELAQLTANLADNLTTQQSKSVSSGSGSRGGFQDKLHVAVRAVESVGDSRIDPYYPNYEIPQPPKISTIAQALPGIFSQAAAIPVYIPPAYTTSQTSAGDEWSLAFQCCSTTLASAEYLAGQKKLNPLMKRSTKRCVSLIDAQGDELFAIRPWAEDKQLPTFRTLTQLYMEIIDALQQISLDTKDGIMGLKTIVQVLQEGPEYLIDIGLIECIIWQAEVIDPNYGADIRNLLDEAVAAQVGLLEFRSGLDILIDIALSPPDGSADDDLGRDAMDAIRRLVKQLRRRINVNPLQQAPTPAKPAPLISALKSSSTQAPPLPSTTYTSHNAQTLQSMFGTGLLPTQSTHPSPIPFHNPQAPSSPTSPTSTSSSQKSTFQYRGHLMTRSALELIQTQEKLAMADSSGQYAGAVSWDDLRNCWIPQWAEKLGMNDLADGEIPNTDPRCYTEQRKDAWGNKIGWYEGRMYYEEEPCFDLRS